MNPCCENPDNLEDVSQPERPDVQVLVCQECGCRHIEVSVDPVQLGVEVK